MEFQLKDTRKRTPAQVEDEIKEDKGFYEDEYGHLVVTAHLGDRRLEPFLPRFLHSKIFTPFGILNNCFQ